jgi:hypothetical protein
MQKLKLSRSMFIDNVLGICPECKEEAFLVAIVPITIDAQIVVKILDNLLMEL